jgi:hypothetical protein
MSSLIRCLIALFRPAPSRCWGCAAPGRIDKCPICVAPGTN